MNNKVQASTTVIVERDRRYVFIMQISSIKTAKGNILGGERKKEKNTHL